MQLARKPPALLLLRGEGTSQRVARDPLRQVGRDRGSRRKDFGEPEVVVAEASVTAGLVVDGDDPDRSLASSTTRRGRR